MTYYRIQEKKESECSDVKGGWDKDKIEKAAINKEQDTNIESTRKN